MTLTPTVPPSESITEPLRPTALPRSKMGRVAAAIGAIGRTLVTAGVVLALFAAFQVWGTGFKEAQAQSSLRDELADRLAGAQARLNDTLPVPDIGDPDSTGAGASGAGAESNDTGTVDAETLELFRPEDGDALARIEIPTIDTDKVVVSGVQVGDLRRGPGLYPSTAQPGSQGNTSIAGHRTTYGAPFGRIDELEPGDEITITTIQGEFVYRVLDPIAAYADRLADVGEVGRGHIIVDPDATWVLGDFGDDRLTLTACHPQYSARQRIIVTAELVGEPADLPADIAAALETGEIDELPTEIISDEVAAADDAGADGGSVTGSDGVDANLDEGLNGDHDAIPVASAWFVAAFSFWILGSRYAKRRRGDVLAQLTIRATAAAPALVCLWFCFEAADRALPAY